jgi:hypothetical protein
VCKGLRVNENSIEQSKRLVDWIGTKLEQIQINIDGRTELAAASYYVTWQHQAAIVRLLDIGLVAPATALQRCVWESYTRGVWLHRGASDKQIAAFRNGTAPDSKSLLKAIEKADGLMNGEWLRQHESRYERLCDLTHTGMGQLALQFKGGHIQADLSSIQLKQLLRFINVIALSALAEAALLGSSQSIAEEALARMRQLAQPIELKSEKQQTTPKRDSGAPPKTG